MQAALEGFMLYWPSNVCNLKNSWHMIGHEKAVDFLSHSVAAGRDSHAYLLTGPEGVGKALLARRIAQTLNCEQTERTPCLACRPCRRIERQSHPDVRTISMETQAAGLKADAAARQKELKIDTVREWQRDIALRPYEGRRRVLIVQDAEALSEEASNAMLKTLEEPPPFATLVLVANRMNLLPTIVSRCQLIRLRPLPRQQLIRALIHERNLEREYAELLAAWSNGRIGWALRMVDSPDEVHTRRERLSVLLELHQQPYSMAFRWAEERSQEYRNGQQALVLEWLELWQSWWRDVLLVAAGCPESISNTDRRGELEQAAQRYSLAAIHAFMVRLGEANEHLRANVNPQLALENVLLHLPA
jgi:DNA polymerase-3 subunit delta'